MTTSTVRITREQRDHLRDLIAADIQNLFDDPNGYMEIETGVRDTATVCQMLKKRLALLRLQCGTFGLDYDEVVAEATTPFERERLEQMMSYA